MQTLSIEWWRSKTWGEDLPHIAAAFRVRVSTEEEAKRVFEAMRGVLRALAPQAKVAEALDPRDG